MKLEFKFSVGNIIGFLVLGGLFYFFCPLPSAALWRGIVCGLVALVLFVVCFVVVSHKGIIRRGPAKKKK